MLICCFYVSFQWATLTTKKPKQKSGNTVKTHCVMFRDGPFENLPGGGGGRSTKKNIRARENSCTPINPKNIHAMA